MLDVYKNRIKRVLKKMSEQNKTACFIVSSAAERFTSRDCEDFYEQSRDFFYLTGSKIKDALLLISNRDNQAFLFVRPPTKLEITWNGKGEDAQKLSRLLGAKLILSEKPRAEILKKISGHEMLIYQNEIKTLAAEIAQEIFSLESHKQGLYPNQFAHLDNFLAEMRLLKDSYEIDLIRAAIKISDQCLKELIPQIAAGKSEQELFTLLNNSIRSKNCELSFTTIMASGASAACLHYSAHNKKLKKEDLLLIDYGARYQGYCADITRTIPVSGELLSWQKNLYEIVLHAQQEAIANIRPDIEIRKVHEAAARVITKGLIDLKIIKGSLKSALKSKSYLPYFPHGIGHSLGLDVHDIFPKQLGVEAVFKKGMVFTVEPGIYFEKDQGKYKASGIRIEDDVLVTSKGCENLSQSIVKY